MAHRQAAIAKKLGAEARMADQVQHIEAGDLLTISEAADLLRVRPSTVRAWLTQHAGKSKLAKIKIGRLTRVLRRDVEELIRAGRVGGNGQ